MACNDWNFVIWGFYYFLLLVMEKAFFLSFLKIPDIFKNLSLACSSVGWVFFYHNDIGKAFQFYNVRAGGKDDPSPELSIHFWNNAVFLIISLIGCTPVMAGIKRLNGEGFRGKQAASLKNLAMPMFKIAVLVLSLFPCRPVLQPVHVL